MLVGAGLVQQVDGLVRQAAIADIALGELGGGLQGVRGIVDLVVLLVARGQPLQDLQGLGGAGLAHQDGVETPLQGLVGLDEAVVLVQGISADDLEAALGQGGLEQAGGIQAAGTGAATDADHGVQFIDEEDDAALGGDDRVAHRFEALLELATHLGPGDEVAHVQGQQALVEQGVRHLGVGDALGQALDDHRLAHPGLADQGRVVLLAPRQGLDDLGDLLLAADDRIQGMLARQFGQVAGEALQGVRLRFRLLGIHVAPVADLLEGGAGLVMVEADFPQAFGGPAALGVEQGKEEGAGGDEAVAQLPGLLLGEAEHLVDIRADQDLVALARHRLLIVGQDGRPQPADGLRHVGHQSLQHPQGLGIRLGEEGEEDEVGGQQVLAQADQFGDRQLQGAGDLFGAELGVVLKDGHGVSRSTRGGW